MTTPWGVEFKENIIVVIHHDVFVVVCHDNLDRAFLFLWDGLRLDAGFNLAVEELLNEGADVLLGDLLLLVKGEFLILDNFLNGEGGPFTILQIEILRVGTESFCVNRSEVDLTLVFLGKGLQSLG